MPELTTIIIIAAAIMICIMFPPAILVVPFILWYVLTWMNDDQK